MNIITLTGNAVKDVELRYSSEGKAIANGTIAVRRDFKDRDGEYKSDFFNFVAFSGQGETMANYIKKGDKFGITGRLQNRVWEKDNGDKQYFTEVMVSGFDFPYKSSNNQTNTNTSGKNSKPDNNDSDPFSGSQSHNILDSDLPF